VRTISTKNQRRKVAAFIGGAAVLLLLNACYSARRGEPITGLVPVKNEKVARGQIVFYQHCNQCHPGGEAGLGPALNNKPAPAFLMKTQVRLGLGAMPAFDKEQISPESLDNLMAYVIQLRKAGHAVD
jgi:mono/diheme cytochrome c family protein